MVDALAVRLKVGPVMPGTAALAAPYSNNPPAAITAVIARVTAPSIFVVE
jgi:hypothetical protein